MIKKFDLVRFHCKIKMSFFLNLNLGRIRMPAKKRKSAKKKTAKKAGKKKTKRKAKGRKKRGRPAKK